MIETAKRLWTKAPIATAILAISMASCIFFGVRIAAEWVYWSDPAHQEQSVAGWMTPGYIGRSWQVPKQDIVQALGAPEPPPPGVRNLFDIADYLDLPVAELIARAEAGIAEFRAQNPRPGEPKP